MCIGPEIAALMSTAGSSLMASLPGIGIGAAGALYNNQIQNAAVDRQNEETQRVIEMERLSREAETLRQNQWADQQSGRTMDALAVVNPTATAGRISERVAAPDNAIVNAADNYALPTLQGQITDSPTGEAIGQSVADAVSRASDLLKAYSTLSEGRVTMGENQDELVRMGTENANTASFRNASAAIAGNEAMMPIPTVTPSSSILGDLLLLGGQAVAGGMGKAAGARVPVPTAPVPMDMASIFGQPLVW